MKIKNQFLAVWVIALDSKGKADHLIGLINDPSDTGGEVLMVYSTNQMVRGCSKEPCEPLNAALAEVHDDWKLLSANLGIEGELGDLKRLGPLATREEASAVLLDGSADDLDGGVTHELLEDSIDENVPTVGESVEIGDVALFCEVALGPPGSHAALDLHDLRSVHKAPSLDGAMPEAVDL